VEKARRLAVGYSIINVAVIRLHHPFSTRNDTSRRKRLAAAQVILNIITYLKPGHPSQINPIMGVSYFFISSFKMLIWIVIFYFFRPFGMKLLKSYLMK
jgi:hypothetical protein